MPRLSEHREAAGDGGGGLRVLGLAAIEGGAQDGVGRRGILGGEAAHREVAAAVRHPATG
jgi:hypothetical protein